MRFASGVKEGATMVKGKNITQTTLYISRKYRNEPNDCINVWLRCMQDSMRDVLITSIPVDQSTLRHGVIEIKNMKIARENLPGKVSGLKFQLEYIFSKEGNQIEVVRSPAFFLEAGGHKIETPKYRSINPEPYDSEPYDCHL